MITKRLKWPLQGLPTTTRGRVQLATTQPGDKEHIASILKVWLLTERGERQLNWNDAQNAASFGVPLRSEVAGTFEPLKTVKKYIENIVRDSAFLGSIKPQIKVTSVQANGLTKEPNSTVGKKVQMTIQFDIETPLDINLDLPLIRLPIYLESEISPDAK